VVDERLRSVLSHPLALPLVCMLNGKNPGSLSYLARDSKFTEESRNPSTDFDNIFSNAVKKWVETYPTKRERKEPQLTKLLSCMIKKESSKTNFHSDDEVGVDCAEVVGDCADAPSVGSKQHVDVLLTPEGKDSKEPSPSPFAPSTPFALIEVGRSDLDWWKKLDQNIKYIDKLASPKG
jgi:hypothetical protein